MVKALIELDDKTNKKLTLIKVEKGLKDKSQTIRYLVSNYNDKDEVKTFEAPDKGVDWMLAENIPDMDFSFSQMWMSCFVDQFASPSGKPYNKILGIYKGYNLEFFFDNPNAKEVAETIVNKIDKNPEFAKQINEEILRHADLLKNDAEKINIKALSDMTDLQLKAIVDEQDRLHTEYYQWCWIPVAADMFHDVLSQKLKKYLESTGTKTLEEDFITLTYPKNKSLIQIEQIEFLELAKFIYEKPKQRELFVKLYNNFREKSIARYGYKTHTKEYEDLLESNSSQLVSDVDQDVLDRIKSHYEKYFHINHMWTGTSYTLEHYLKELVKLIGTHSNIDQTIKDIDTQEKEANKKRDKLIKNLEPKWAGIFLEYGEFMVTKIYRRFAQIYALYKMEYVHKEIARRYGLTLKHVRFMTPVEIGDMLVNGYVDRKEIDKRTKLCVYYVEKGKEIMYTGEEAQAIVDRVKHQEIEQTSELKGQVACLGEATGIVKIVIRPEDMEKMKEGDILVSIATDPDIVPAMKKAAAIVTEQGGVTSHAAIVSREMGTPCVIGTKIATKVFKDGDKVHVNARKGIVTKLD